MRINIKLNDALFLFALFLSAIDVILQWAKFEGCKHPIQLWLLISYALLVLFRLSHYLGSALSGDDNDHYLLHQRRGPPSWIHYLSIGLLFPCFTAWTVVGSLWFADIERSTPHCLPRNSHPWFVIFWLSMCYVWIGMYCFLIVIALMFEMRSRQAEHDLTMLHDDEVLRRWGQLDVLTEYGIHFVRRGLSLNNIRALPSYRITKENLEWANNASPCPICLMDVIQDDEVRLLNCGHVYHRECIDVWIFRKASCPTCKSVITKKSNYSESYI
eukprot:GHVL01028493.1.p1 GENE.GHVL01028493.1~~GHVL01028493.1.p1  ORF type:complete len:272 (+),score=22.66 GHVL01028493.1:127-942(+)